MHRRRHSGPVRILIVHGVQPLHEITFGHKIPRDRRFSSLALLEEGLLSTGTVFAYLICLKVSSQRHAHLLPGVSSSGMVLVEQGQ